MATKEIKTIQHYMRALHRDIGFLVIGLTIVFCLSGVVLIFRDTDFLKSENQVERKLDPQLNESKLGMELHIRNFEVIKSEGDIIYFKNGTYNKSAGIAVYSDKKLPAFFEKLNGLHKASSSKITSWFSLIFGVLLLFLAISSFWMFKVKSKMFRRGIIIAGAGIIVTFLLLLF